MLNRFHIVVDDSIVQRHDSTIPTPYRKWLYYDPRVKEKEQNKNYALNKTKKVAWFVSKCDTWNNRMGYVKQLQNYIDVNIHLGEIILSILFVQRKNNSFTCV